jgi:hypothetical protein
MQVSNISQQAYGSSVYEKQVLGKVKQDKNTIEPQKTQITARTKSLEISSEYDLTNMTSDEMLGLAASFFDEGNIRDFMTLAAFSARAAFEDHPDPSVKHTWQTPRNNNGTFDLLAEVQAPNTYSTGSSMLDEERQTNYQRLLDTLLSLPVRSAKIEKSSIDIKS